MFRRFIATFPLASFLMGYFFFVALGVLCSLGIAIPGWGWIALGFSVACWYSLLCLLLTVYHPRIEREFSQRQRGYFLCVFAGIFLFSYTAMMSWGTTPLVGVCVSVSFLLPLSFVGERWLTPLHAVLN